MLNVTHVTLMLKAVCTLVTDFTGFSVTVMWGLPNHGTVLSIPLSLEDRDGLGSVFIPLHTNNPWRAFKLTGNRQSHRWEKAGKLLTSLAVLGLSE